MSDFLLLATLLLVAGVISVPLATRFKLGSVLGYLLAGMALSPLLAKLGTDVIELQHIAEFGVVMMLFLVGLELEPAKLWKLRHHLLGLGGLQVGVTTFLITAAMWALQFSWQTALAVGLILSLSSTAIVLQSLEEQGLLRSDGGRASFSILLFQDIAVIPMLALLPLLATQSPAEAVHTEAHHGFDLLHGVSPGWQALITLGAIAFVLAFGRTLAQPLFRFVAMARLRELFTATALMIVFGIALLMTVVGLSPALGTFLAGVVLATSEYRHQLESDIAPFKGLLLGLFFITVGASIDFTLLATQPMIIIGAALALILLKGLVLLALTRLFQLRPRDGWLVTLSLPQAGEFAFVLLTLAASQYVLPAALANQIQLVVTLSMLATPLLLLFYQRNLRAKLRNESQAPDAIEAHGDTIIIGHGRVGGTVNRMLRAAGFDTTVIDYSATQLDMLRKFGFRVYFGDGTRPDLLQAAGIERAKLLVIAIDSREQTTELARYVQQNFPHVHVIARATDRTHVYDLWSVGCRDIIRETYDSSLRMGRSAFAAMGYTDEQAQILTDEFNRRDQIAMRETADVYQLGVPLSENQAYVDKVREIMKQWEVDLLGQGQLDGEESNQDDNDSNLQLPKG